MNHPLGPNTAARLSHAGSVRFKSMTEMTTFDPDDLSYLTDRGTTRGTGQQITASSSKRTLVQSQNTSEEMEFPVLWLATG